MGIKKHFDKVFLDKVPIMPVKGNRKPIWTMGFVRPKNPNGYLDFFFFNGPS